MFDIGMTELLLVGIVALIVVGPKDLPGLFRTLGRFTAKARSLGREFTRAMNDAADESGVKDVAGDLRKVANPKSMGLDALKDAADKFEQWDPSAHPAAKHGKDVLADAQKEAEEKAAERASDAKASTAKAAPKSRATAKSPKPKADAKTTSKPRAKPKSKPRAKPRSSAKAAAKPVPKADSNEKSNA